MFTWVPGSLNAEQEQAITDAGNVLLVACPGSGKTRTLTYKVAYELDRVDSRRQYVAAITYTHRAADEIEERIASLGVATEQLWIGTIHSFCLEWILKPYGVYHPQLRDGFRVINSHESEAILERLCAESQERITVFDCGYHFDENGVQLESSKLNLHEAIDRTIIRYLQELQSSRQVDFALMLRYSYELIRDHPEISQILSKLFTFIAIDEYQDTTKIQYLILGSIIKASEGSARTLMVGDPNQAIFTSLGGFAIRPAHFRSLIGGQLTERVLSKNYRSSLRIIEYFGNYNVHRTAIEPAFAEDGYPSLVTFNDTVTRNELEHEIVRLVRHSVENLQVHPSQICIVAPWWAHLASMTRSLVTALPEYDFDGPGLTPFSRDPDNFWYKLARISLTEASPAMYVRRLRWARDLLTDLAAARVDVSRMTARLLLLESNSVELATTDGLDYLQEYFDQLFTKLGINRADYPTLEQQHVAFFQSSSDRVARMIREGAPFMADVSVFRRAFQQRSGITVSTIHGVKGAEFDTVIAYALLDGMVPHFNDSDQIDGAKKLLYVIASRARRNVHLLAERGRKRGRHGEYETSVPLQKLAYAYDSHRFGSAI